MTSRSPKSAPRHRCCSPLGLWIRFRISPWRGFEGTRRMGTRGALDDGAQCVDPEVRIPFSFRQVEQRLLEAQLIAFAWGKHQRAVCEAALLSLSHMPSSEQCV